MYQVVITEPTGRIHGKTFTDPIPAIQEFGKNFASPRFKRKGQVMFQQLGQLVVVLDEETLTHAEVLKNGREDVFVKFHSSSTKEDFIPRYKRFVELENKTVFDYVAGALVDLKTQEVVLAFDEEQLYGV